MDTDSDPRRMRRLARTRGSEDEVDEEIQFHLELTTNFYESTGMPRDEARRAAERRFGNVDRYRRALSSAGRRSGRRRALTIAVDNLREDFGFAFRYARRSYGFTFGVALMIALGVGANATMYGIIDRILLTPPPHIQQA